MTYKRPGVYVSESLLQATPSFFPAATVGAFVGTASRGPANVATLVTSWAQFNTLFGGFNGYTAVGDTSLPHAVFQFFNNGGSACWIVRATGSSIATATRTLVDRETTPAAILAVSAISPGAWGNGLYVEITDGASAGRFNLNVRLVPTGASPADQYLVERWTDLAMDPTDPRYAPSIINSSTIGSTFITVVDQFNHANSFTPSQNIPADSAQPGGDALTAGADGTAPTLGASGQLYTAVTALAMVSNMITLNCPNLTDTATINAILTFAQSRNNIFLVVDCQAGRTPTQVISDAAALTPTSFGAIYYPRLIVADPSSSIPGATKTIAPGGAVVGEYCATDTSRGIFKAPAGIGTRLTGVVAMEYRPVDTDLDNLNAANVNAIRKIPGNGFCIFGARTLKPNQVDMYVSARRTLMAIENSLITATRFAVFEPNSSQLWAQMTAAMNQVLLQLWQAGGLAGSTANQAYFITCDSSVNTPASIASGQVNATVGVALQTPAEFVVLNIGQYQSGSSVTEVV